MPASAGPKRGAQDIVAAGPSHASASGSGSDQPGHADVLEASRAVAKCLNGRFKWALVGGAAVVALGSRRVTEDVDVVIAPPAQLKEAKNALRTDSRFTVDKRTRHTTFASANSARLIDIEFLSYPGTFKAPFVEATDVTKTESGVNVLPVPALLESKCSAIASRSQESKRTTDASDIKFVLDYMVSNGTRTSREEVPSATPAFQEWFEQFVPGSRRLFGKVGL
ncbi:MAG: hypothetical protein M1833_003186 [Piccolia ochrophora]|nr:MAG: hypothetical protein M1833_003186 [Piccolia ochrophora]